MIDAERPETTEVEVVVGVDTHLHFHVEVAVDHLGREALRPHRESTLRAVAELLHREKIQQL